MAHKKISQLWKEFYEKNKDVEYKPTGFWSSIGQGIVDAFSKKDTSSKDKNDIQTWMSNSLTGDLDYQRQMNMLQAEQAFNSAESEKNRQFNLDMANTAYSRQAQDLQRAGYNPSLVLSGGGANVVGSNTPYANQQAYSHSQNILPLVSSVVNGAFTLASNSMKNNTALKIAELNTKNNSAYTKATKVTPKWYNQTKNTEKKVDDDLGDIMKEIVDFFS